MDTEKQRQSRNDDVRLTKSGNARSKQLLVMPELLTNRMAARRALEWIGTSKARLGFRYKISNLFLQSLSQLSTCPFLSCKDQPTRVWPNCNASSIALGLSFCVTIHLIFVTVEQIRTPKVKYCSECCKDSSPRVPPCYSASGWVHDLVPNLVVLRAKIQKHSCHSGHNPIEAPQTIHWDTCTKEMAGKGHTSTNVLTHSILWERKLGLLKQKRVEQVPHGESIFGHHRQVAALRRSVFTGLVQLWLAAVTSGCDQQ